MEVRDERERRAKVQKKEEGEGIKYTHIFFPNNYFNLMPY